MESEDRLEELRCRYVIRSFHVILWFRRPVTKSKRRKGHSGCILARTSPVSQRSVCSTYMAWEYDSVKTTSAVTADAHYGPGGDPDCNLLPHHRILTCAPLDAHCPLPGSHYNTLPFALPGLHFIPSICQSAHAGQWTLGQGLGPLCRHTHIQA